MVSVTPRSVREAALLPLPGAVTNAKWRAHGAFEDAFYIRATNWWARMPDGRWIDRLRILSSGGFRAKGVGGGAWTNYPPPFAQKLSLAPEANWLLLGEATGGTPVVPVNGQDARSPSLFWHSTTPSNTFVISWIGGLYGRSYTNLVDFQAELFNDGSFDYRYADRTEHFAASLPFDLDGDGLENSVDPDPLTAGPDAHGTNAEWYNTVCSNVLEAVADGGTGTTGILPVGGGWTGTTGILPVGNGWTGTTGILPVGGDCVLSWRADVNSNAYYFVDVVTERGPAPIYFMGDRESRLGNPVVVARAFETNHVPLLIGINYAVTSTVPISISFPDDGFAAVTTNGVSNYAVQWPLNFVFTESIDEGNRVYSVTVEPYDPGGELTWNGAGGGMRSGTPSECDCGCLRCGGYSVWFSCSAICTCSGECQAVGNYTVEDALFAVTGGVCRCGFDDPVPCEISTTNLPSFSVSFSKHAVIFEDAYEDSPGVMKPKRSSRVRITIDAYGGEYGGVLALSSANLGKLTPVGNGVTLPPSRTLTADEYFHTTGVYEGAVESMEEDDVSVNGSFTEYVTAQRHLSSNRLTVVKVLLRPTVTAPDNNALGRHEYGVCELVRLDQYPSAPVVTWNPIGGGSNAVNQSDHPCYRLPLLACENPLRVELKGAMYMPLLSCIEPSGIEVREVDLCTYGLPAGKAGGIGLLQAFYVKPFTVSFSEIAVEEVPCDEGFAEGYFRYAMPSNFWSHTTSAGAGKWIDVFPGNRMGNAQFRDEAAIALEMLPITPDGTLTNDYAFGWTEGEMEWNIPFGWNAKGTTNGTEAVGQFEGTKQEFYIDEWGFTGVRKFHNQVTRTTNDVRRLNFKRITNNEVRRP